MIEIKNIQELCQKYRVILCDVWGVLHDGVAVYPQAAKALQQLKKRGCCIILITNSPRLSGEVAAQLCGLGIGKETYDALITSGDATRGLIAAGPRRLFYIGGHSFESLIADIDVEFVEETEAQGILCTGLSADIGAEIEAYTPLLRRLRSRDLPFICANPDIFVLYGNSRVWCAGALARAYAQMGGRTLIAGKPHSPIYEMAFGQAERIQGPFSKEEVLVVGDGILTDIKGAVSQGVDSLYIAKGMHKKDYTKGTRIEARLLEEFFQRFGFSPSVFMEELC